MTPDLRHPRHARVRRGADFERVFKHGKRVALPAAALHWRTNDAEVAPPASDAGAPKRTWHRPSTMPRLGLAVSRKVDPDAVGRNRIKRAWREAFRHVRTQLPVADYVMVARPPARALDNAALRALLLTLLHRAGALPLPDAAVTLPPAAAPAADLPSIDSTSAPAPAEPACRP